MDIVAAARAQMLGQLIDTLGQGAAKTAAVAQLSLTQGQVISAVVLGEIADGKLALKFQGQTIVADIKGSQLPPEARLPGAALHLRVDSAGSLPRLTFMSAATPQPGSAPSAVPLTPEAGAPALRILPSQAAAPAPPSPLQAALTEATARAATRQGSAAPLYADLAYVTADVNAPLPETARKIASLILANRLDGDGPITAADVKRAVQASGVFSEAQAARGQPTLDAKALLGGLRALLTSNQAPPARHNAVEPPPEPPHRDAAVSAQRPAMASLATQSDPQITASMLGREAEQALERVTLHQIASLPDQRPSGPDGARPQHLSFELPIVLAGQTAMAGFRVEREPHHRKADGTPVDSWGIRFAIETDEIGAVYAHIRLAGADMNVSLWADDALTHRSFVDALPRLEAALRDNALNPGEISILSGRPHGPRAVPSGRFLDVSS